MGEWIHRLIMTLEPIVIVEVYRITHGEPHTLGLTLLPLKQ